MNAKTAVKSSTGKIITEPDHLYFVLKDVIMNITERFVFHAVVIL